MQSIRGTKDILPQEISSWHAIEQIIRSLTAQYGYQEIRTPIMEYAEVFKRSVGEETDIVGKEMYTFPDRGGDDLTLRPEATASVVRAAIQHNLTAQQQIARLYYVGPFFRYERPQKGRQRQFHQFGCELMGSATPDADVEILSLAHDFVNALGITSHQLNINTLATPSVRKQFKDRLVEYFSAFQAELSEDSTSRLSTNPLRILDSKNPGDKALCEKAPSLLDMLDNESKDHFDAVLSMLDALHISYVVNPRLVRGLDYYSHTVFEITSTALGSQDALGGGGRYDHLFAHFGGKHTPCIGFGFGMERLLLAKTAEQEIDQKQNADVYVIGFETSDSRLAVIEFAHTLRNSLGKKVITDVQQRSLKAQMKEADKLGVKHVIIIGPDEVQSGTCVIKHLETSMQFTKQRSDVKDLFVVQD
ncbi:MAG: histidine--tRNA ligase [Candidatus Kapaibacteriota bacterium]